jgi:hypothetical protein
MQELKIGKARADGKKACQMCLRCALIYTTSSLQVGGPRLSLTVAILAKGRCFFGPSAYGLRPCRNLNLSFQQINIARGYFGLRSFGLESKLQYEEAQGIRRMKQIRSYAQGSIGMIAEKETDLKMKRLFRPRWITIELLANVKGMGVIFHGMRPVPINR